ncbi:MAG: ATP-citrate synthase (ATP-citrate (Pro-S-)-lyase)(Citrate cleavage enzyme) [Acetothermia bacterium 64_32]|nr:MAG: ATP-citrate synthase (ATP-citrate (Pro-S-)-lyase)(Citrate cleavage enzyme) [Acetothermia bacterium 64_32]HAF70441.1 ATPase [Candidatus Acetothermia bacterium]
MAQRGIREYHGKAILHRNWADYFGAEFRYPFRAALVGPDTDLAGLQAKHPWLRKERLVVKPDQLFGKRGKHGLVQVDKTWEEVRAWIETHQEKRMKIGNVEGKLTHFLVEPYIPHAPEEERYLAFTTGDDGDTAYMSPLGGVDIEELWDKVVEVHIPSTISIEEVEELIRSSVPEGVPDREAFGKFASGLYRLFCDLHFTYLELNPVVIKDDEVFPLDLVARLDDTAQFLVGKKWGQIEFPAPFGRELTPEEGLIKELDEKSGASLKLTILNPEGRIWTLVAGGGASVVYTDTIADLGAAGELANYGEYSGNPTTSETYAYAKTVLDLMTRKPDPKGRPKVLIIGGGIANFTDVSRTFDGIIQALREYADRLKKVGVRIYVRRGGPGYQEGLRRIKEACEELGLPCEVYGPELHMTAIVPMALKEA